jgi:hypothetical protein
MPMAIGPLAGGFVFDTFNAYSWLYIGSFSLGLGAMAVAFARFRRCRGRVRSCSRRDGAEILLAIAREIIPQAHVGAAKPRSSC